MDNQTALAYMMKLGRIKYVILTQKTKEIWVFCISQDITLTAKNRFRVKNTKVDHVSVELQKSLRKWILHKRVLTK